MKELMLFLIVIAGVGIGNMFYDACGDKERLNRNTKHINTDRKDRGRRRPAMIVTINAPEIPAEQPGKYYVNLNGIRLIMLYGEVTGFYNPEKPDDA